MLKNKKSAYFLTGLMVLVGLGSGAAIMANAESATITNNTTTNSQAVDTPEPGDVPDAPGTIDTPEPGNKADVAGERADKAGDKDGFENFAVEICRDYGMGKLKNVLYPELQFQFVLANNLLGVSPEKALVGNEGMLVFAEGKDPQKSWAYIRKNRNLIPLRGNETAEYILFS